MPDASDEKSFDGVFPLRSPVENGDTACLFGPVLGAVALEVGRLIGERSRLRAALESDVKSRLAPPRPLDCEARDQLSPN